MGEVEEWRISHSGLLKVGDRVQKFHMIITHDTCDRFQLIATNDTL